MVSKIASGDCKIQSPENAGEENETLKYFVML